MMVTLSNGTRLALPDDLDAQVLQAQIELAEEEIAEKKALAREAKEDEIPTITMRGRRK